MLKLLSYRMQLAYLTIVSSSDSASLCSNVFYVFKCTSFCVIVYIY